MLDLLDILAATAEPVAPALHLRAKRSRLHHDFETFSFADVTKCGASRYARDPSTEVLMCAYAFNDEDERQWVPAEDFDDIPAELEDAMLDDRIIKYAWNKPFEWNIWTHVLGIETPHRAWRDPMVLALTLSLPGKLSRCGPIVGLGEDVLKKDGTRLINWFSKMRPATKTKPTRRVHPWEKKDLWEQYKEYNRYDVRAERAIYKKLRKFDLPQHEWDLWVLDQEINTRGVPVNLEMAKNAVEVRDEVIEQRLEEMQDITGLANPGSPQQLLPWLQDQGYPFADLKIGHVRRSLQKLDDDIQGGTDPEDFRELRRVLELRMEVSRAAPKKFDALLAHADEDGVIRNTVQFAAAGRTWRWGGRGYQIHNLAKPEKYLEDLEWETQPLGYGKVVGGTQIRAAQNIERLSFDAINMLYSRPMDVLAACTRPVIQAPPGYVFIDADLAAIENVVLGFLADEQRILRVFRKGLDPYIDFATYLYERAYEHLFAEYKNGDKGPRTVAKPGVLGCGYMLSAGKEYEDKKTGEMEATGLLGYGRAMGVFLTHEQAQLSVDVWRRTFKKAVKFWYEIEGAAKDCLKRSIETSAGPVSFDYKKPFMRMHLPSGRALHYCRADVREWLAPWGEYKPTVTYEQIEKHQWKRVSTHPGKLTENADQAIARDILAHGMRNATREGIPIVFHVHDQIVGLAKEEHAHERLRTLIECMTDLPDWCGDLPVKAAGHISKWFVKD